jgi:RNA polymerase sigma-70 factor (ECF subfamily)
MRIAWRMSMTRRRRLRWSRRWASLDDDGAPDPPAPTATPERSTLDADLRRTVRRVVGGLPAKFREPLLLAASGEHAYAEIAEVMGLPEGTVKWRVSEARRLLRQRLQRLGLDHA